MPCHADCCHMRLIFPLPPAPSAGSLPCLPACRRALQPQGSLCWRLLLWGSSLAVQHSVHSAGSSAGRAAQGGTGEPQTGPHSGHGASQAFPQAALLMCFQAGRGPGGQAGWLADHHPGPLCVVQANDPDQSKHRSRYAAVATATPAPVSNFVYRSDCWNGGFEPPSQYLTGAFRCGLTAAAGEAIAVTCRAGTGRAGTVRRSGVVWRAGVVRRTGAASAQAVAGTVAGQQWEM